MERKFKPEEQAECPSCGKPLDNMPHGAAHNYVILAMKHAPTKLGAASAAEDECGWCEARFLATRTAENEITFRAL